MQTNLRAQLYTELVKAVEDEYMRAHARELYREIMEVLDELRDEKKEPVAFSRAMFLRFLKREDR
jgi:recombinational DNA repair protein (RecF pathway)